MSIKAYFFVPIGLLAAAAIAVSIAFLDLEWAIYRRTTAVASMTRTFSAMLEVADAMGLERGIHTAVIGARTVLPETHPRRALVDERIEQARGRLRQLRLESTRQIATLDEIEQDIRQSRLEIDAWLAKPSPGEARAFEADYLARISRAADRIGPMLDALETEVAATADPIARNFLQLARLAAELRELFGRRAAKFNEIVSDQGPLARDDEMVLARLGGQIELSFSRTTSLVDLVDRVAADRGERLDADLAGTLARMRASAIEPGRALHERLVEAGRAGASYGFTTPALRAYQAQLVAFIRPLRDMAIDQALAVARRERHGALRDLLLTAGALLLVTVVAVGTVLVARQRVVQPLAALTRIVLRLANNERDLAVPALQGRHEIGRLAQAIETLRLNAVKAAEIEAQLRQVQKMQAVGQLTGGIAHDFNNLLGTIIGNLDLLMEDTEPGSERAELVQLALDSALRGADLTRRMLAFARQQPLQAVPLALNDALSGIVPLLERTLGEHIVVRLKPADDLWQALADPSQVESVVLSLAVNARDAMPDGGLLVIETENIRFEDMDAAAAGMPAGDYVVLAITDSGTGMPPDVVERAFEPFFTTKDVREVGRGTGLGLSMVHGFARQSGGHVKIYSEVGRGTTIRLYLPRALDDAAAEPSHAADHELATGTETILLVEDDAQLRRTAVRMLEDLGYHMLEAENAPTALDLLDRESGIDLLFTDVVMPGGMTGPDLAREARRRRPGLRVLLASGYSRHFTSSKDAGDDHVRLVSKPYRKRELAHEVRRALDERHPAAGVPQT